MLTILVFAVGCSSFGSGAYLLYLICKLSDEVDGLQRQIDVLAKLTFEELDKVHQKEKAEVSPSCSGIYWRK